MPSILIDPAIPAGDLRQRLYSGDLIILTRLRALEEFVDYMRDELTKLFAPHDPEHVHEYIEPAEMAKILGSWKPRWIHAERSRELVRAIIADTPVVGGRQVATFDVVADQPAATLNPYGDGSVVEGKLTLDVAVIEALA